MNYILLVLGLILLIKGADFLINSASKIARILGVPAFIVGLSIVAFGTSAPEAEIGVFSGIKGTNQINLGNVIGSSITNITLILGLTAVIRPLKIEPLISKREIPLSFIIQVIMAVMIYTGLILSRPESILLLIGFVAFLFYLGKSSKNAADKKEPEDEYAEEILSLLTEEELLAEGEERIKNGSEVRIEVPSEIAAEVAAEVTAEATAEGAVKRSGIVKLIVFLLLGLTGLIVGSNLIVDSSTAIARTLGLSDRFIGITVIALGTSLPELVTCLAAAFRKEEGIAVGNIIGSNIFNILFVLGLSSTITPIAVDLGVFVDIGIMILVTVLLFVPAFLHKKISRISGTLFVIVYIMYITYKVIGIG